MDRGGSKSASGFGPGGPNPRGVQIRCDTGSPVFSINFTNQSIKNSQAILKFFIGLKSTVWFTLVSDFRSIKYFRIA